MQVLSLYSMQANCNYGYELYHGIIYSTLLEASLLALWDVIRVS